MGEYNEFLEHIYKAWYLGMMCWKCHQNWCLNTETAALFGQTVKKNHFYTHAQPMGLHVPYVYVLIMTLLMQWHFDYWFCCMQDDTTVQIQYLRWGSIELHVHVKWFLIICLKRVPISLFQHQCWCYFHQILLRYHTLWISSNKFILFPHVRNVTFKECQVYFKPLCIGNKTTIGIVTIFRTTRISHSFDEYDLLSLFWWVILTNVANRTSA